MSENTIRVALVDDQPLLRTGFGLILDAEDDLDVVGEASDGAAAVQLVARLKPDVVLMDVRMPVMDGIEATRRIVGEFPDTRVIILTTFDLDEYAFNGLTAGASAFLLKDVDPEELVRAVRLVASGDAVVAPRVTKRLLEAYVRPGGAAKATATAALPVVPPEVARGLAELTPREREILGAMAAGRSNQEIATEFFVSEATVKTHVRRVLAKLNLRDRVQAVVFAYEYGIVTPGGEG
ncbi:response regulator [Galactobacter valiniphilus]|uniref:DNA-binding response regulator n=1 Tax=Galactobacter valiniphilus TaxID=2676122 RepID=A0A399JAY5_9MICC|nr:response regulator transcription factor [Galactobacter valiniphilus]RII41182.1 DNA-binding response regulator [Galactobacter valiniphilus]